MKSTMAELDASTMSTVDVQALYKAITVINKLAVELDIDAAMSSVRQVALDLLECDRVSLFLIIDSRRELRAKTGDPDGATITVKFGEGIAGTVAQQGGLMNIEDAYISPLFNFEVDRMTKYTTKSVLCCAIADMSGKNIAVLQALNKRTGAFTKVDEQLIILFGVHLGNTLAKSRFYEEAKRERARLATLNRCFKRLNAVTNLSGALDTIAAAVKELVCARYAVVLLMDAVRGAVWASITNQNTAGEAKLFRVKQGQGVIAGCAADMKQVALCLTDQPGADKKLLQLYELLSSRKSKLSDVLLQPVVDAATSKCMAVLCALNKQERPAGNDIFYEHTFTPSDCEALNVFSMEVADLLSQRALEVSFASAMSGTMSGPGAAQQQLTSMLKAQLLDYYSGRGDGGMTHSAEVPVANTGGSSKEDDLDSILSNSAPLARCSSAAEDTYTSSSSLLTSPLSPARSFHHQLPSFSRTESAIADIRSQLLSWDLDCSLVTHDELSRLAYDIFKMSGVVDELELPVRELSRFLSAVASHYHDVPYHNFTHAVQVLHTVWMIMEHTSARTVLSSGEELVLLVAAICHDVDHDGFTNSYHINSQSELAQRYNDKSVQENHHCALTFQLLRTSGNLLSSFTERSEWQAARRLLVESILSTDMHSHFALTQELQKHSLIFRPDVEEDRVLLVKAVLHAADISNPIRPFPAALSSAQRVHSEFQRQVAHERQLELPVAPHMDATDPAVWAEMELQFIDYVVGPLWGRLGQIFPALQQPIQQLQANRSRFLAMSKGSPGAAVPEASGGQAAVTAPNMHNSSSFTSLDGGSGQPGVTPAPVAASSKQFDHRLSPAAAEASAVPAPAPAVTAAVGPVAAASSTASGEHAPMVQAAGTSSCIGNGQQSAGGGSSSNSSAAMGGTLLPAPGHAPGERSMLQQVGELSNGHLKGLAIRTETD